MSKSDLWNAAYENRIYPDKVIEGDRVILSYKGSEVFAEGTISCIVAQAKQKKTFFLSLLVEQLLNATGDFKSDFCDEVLWFDTEQSERRIQTLTKRFSKPELITFITIRQYNIADRYKIIEEGIERIQPSIVVIDGIAELVEDVNDGANASNLVNKLLQWCSKHKCHISTVLHLNPGSNKPRGALGTTMMHKSSLVMDVKAVGEKTRAKTSLSRDNEVEPITFNIDNDGVPKII